MSEEEWDADCWDSLTEERKQQLMKEAEALFNSDKSPLSFMVQSSGSIGYSKLPQTRRVAKEKPRWKFW